MKEINGYTFNEVLEIIQNGEKYRGFEHVIIKFDHIRIEHENSCFINWEDLQKDLFIKVK